MFKKIKELLSRRGKKKAIEVEKFDASDIDEAIFTLAFTPDTIVGACTVHKNEGTQTLSISELVNRYIEEIFNGAEDTAISRKITLSFMAALYTKHSILLNETIFTEILKRTFHVKGPELFKDNNINTMLLRNPIYLQQLASYVNCDMYASRVRDMMDPSILFSLCLRSIMIADGTIIESPMGADERSDLFLKLTTLFPEVYFEPYIPEEFKDKMIRTLGKFIPYLVEYNSDKEPMFERNDHTNVTIIDPVDTVNEVRVHIEEHNFKE